MASGVSDSLGCGWPLSRSQYDRLVRIADNKEDPYVLGFMGQENRIITFFQIEERGGTAKRRNLKHDVEPYAQSVAKEARDEGIRLTLINLVAKHVLSDDKDLQHTWAETPVLQDFSFQYTTETQDFLDEVTKAYTITFLGPAERPRRSRIQRIFQCFSSQ